MNYHDDIKAYLDGELSPERMEEMRAAIEADPGLRQEAESMKLITSRIQSMAKVPPVKGLEGALSKVAPQKPWINRNWTWAAPAAAFVTIAFGMTMFSQSGGSSAETAAKVSFRQADTASTPAPSSESAREESFSGMEAPPVGGGPGGGGENTLQNEMKSPLNGSSSEAPSRGRAGAQESEDARNYAEKPANPTKDVNPEILIEPRDRDVIRDASMTVEVEDARKAKDALIRAVEEARGFVESSDLQADEEKAVAHVRARIPINAFSGVISQAKEMGFVVAENQTGEDVTLKIVDADSRIKTHRIQEEQYRLMLRDAKKMGEILEIKEKIGVVRANIESLEAQRDAIKKLADLSTLNATFEQKKGGHRPGQADDWADDSWAGAVSRFDAVWRVVATFLMNLFALAPFWLPVGLGVWWYRTKIAKPAA